MYVQRIIGNKGLENAARGKRVVRMSCTNGKKIIHPAIGRRDGIVIRFNDSRSDSILKCFCIEKFAVKIIARKIISALLYAVLLTIDVIAILRMILHQ